MRKLEVLAPAGDLERVKMALLYGADAVYLSGPEFGMRPVGRLGLEELEAALRLCHEKGARLYVTCNTTPTEAELARLPEYLGTLQELEPDAVIVGDLGVLRLCRRYCPRLPLHVSTQAGVLNSAAATELCELGASRVIPAREMSLEGFRALREKTPAGLEIEAFVHGSMCISVSGRCLLSDYITGRPMNSGRCAQPCRWSYALMEQRGSGAYFPIEEDERGSYILNSRDMCLIDHIGELWDAGVDSLKIEGRSKSAYYVATVTNAYRHAADAAMAGEPLDPLWSREPYQLSHRPYSTGFFFGYPGQNTEGSDYYTESEFIAAAEESREDGLTLLRQRNRFAPGEELELLLPGGPAPLSFVCGALRGEDGRPVTDAKTPMEGLWTRLPVPVPPGTIVRRRGAEQHRRRQQP